MSRRFSPAKGLRPVGLLRHPLRQRFIEGLAGEFQISAQEMGAPAKKELPAHRTLATMTNPQVSDQLPVDLVRKVVDLGVAGCLVRARGRTIGLRR